MPPRKFFNFNFYKMSSLAAISTNQNVDETTLHLYNPYKKLNCKHQELQKHYYQHVCPITGHYSVIRIAIFFSVKITTACVDGLVSNLVCIQLL